MTTGSAAGLGVRIERQSTHKQVAAALREAILSGTILPGTRLREIPLSTELGVSRNTVREASRVLAAEGLVRYEMNHGVWVIELSDADIEELYQARGVLETAGATRLVAGGATALSVLARLRELLARIEVGVASRDVDAVLKDDHAFHAVLVSATGNKRLCQWHATVQQELRLALTLAEHNADALGRSGDDHRQLLDALASGDLERAQPAVLAHLAAGATELHRLRMLVQQRVAG